MDAARYMPFWTAVKPEFENLIAAISRAIEAHKWQPIRETYTGGDEELKLSQDWSHPELGNDCLMGVDVVLVDGEINDDQEGLAVRLDIQSNGGAHVMSLVPNNLTDDLYTLDVDELKARVKELHGYVGDIASAMIDGASMYANLERGALSRPQT